MKQRIRGGMSNHWAVACFGAIALWLASGCSSNAAVDPGAAGSTADGGAGGAAGGGVGGMGVGGSGEVGAAGLDCAPGEVQVEGTLGSADAAFQAAPFQVLNFGDTTSIAWLMDDETLRLSSLGITYFKGTTPLGVSHPTGGVFRMRAGGSWQFACAGEGSTTTVGEGFASFELAQVATLGSCPGGQPVTGTIEVCYGGATTECDPGSVHSTLAGATFDAELLSDLGHLPQDSSVATMTAYLPAAGLAHDAPIQLNAPGPLEAAVEAGYFVVPDGQPDAGAVYCI